MVLCQVVDLLKYTYSSLCLDLNGWRNTKVMVALPFFYDSTMSCCFAVCPEVTIRHSIVKGEMSCPHSHMTANSLIKGSKGWCCMKWNIRFRCLIFAGMCLLCQDLTWWKHLVWRRELTRLWRAWQPSLLCSTPSPPTLCTETPSWHRAPSEIIL